MSREDSPVNVPFPGRRTRIVSRVSKGLILALMAFLSFTVGLPIHTADAAAPSPSGTQAGSTSGLPAGLATGLPQGVGADRVSDLSLPRTVLSSVDSLIGAGGVIQDSPQNLTLYNSAVAIRLLGGPVPHDQLLGPGGRVLSHWSFWRVEVQVGGAWLPLLPSSSNFTIFGTNTTGTYVVRTMQVGTGSYSGQFKIAYKATSAGPLKWDLTFAAGSSGHYKLVYAWWNITREHNLSSPSGQFRVGYGVGNYTLSWSDVPSALNTTASILPGQFLLSIDLGTVVGGSSVRVDPSVVGPSSSSSATAYTFQRKVFYEPKGGYYFVFYYDGISVGYRYSHDGISWSSLQAMPGGWPAFYDGPSSLLTVVNSGQTVLVATGQTKADFFICSGTGCGGSDSVSAYYSVGIISGPLISWQPDPVTGQVVRVVATMTRSFASSTPSFSATIGIRYVNLAFSSDGYLAFSFNFYADGPGSGICSLSYSTESDLIVTFKGGVWFADCENSGSQLRSVILPADSNGAVRVVYQRHVGSGVQLASRLLSISTSNGVLGPINTVGDTYVDSSVANANYGTSQVLWVRSPTNSAENDVLVKFNPSVPSGSAITHATLTLTAAGTGSGVDNVDVYEPAASWDEMTVTFLTKPAVIPSSISRTPNVNLASYTIGSALSLDVTNAIAGVYRGSWSDNGLMVTLPPTSGSGLWYAALYSREFNGGSSSPTLTITYVCCIGPVETLWTSVPDTDQFSAISDSDYGAHVVYAMGDGTVGYAYRNPSGTSWAITSDIFSGQQASSPTITADMSTNDVYAFAVQGSSISMKRKSSTQTWADQSTVFPVTARNGPTSLGSNFASASATNSSSIMILWTEGPASGPFSVMFASIPIQTVWSPYASPGDPWDRNGLAPYGQYFANLGEYVSPSSGMLTVRQTDMSLAGRGLNLEITRVYTEPYSFLNGSPFNFESYPWAPLGNGWQLNFPWMVNSPTPLYLHLWNGEGYRIPSSFWTGATATFENHQGEHFRLVRNSTGIFLYSKSAVSYSFDPAPNRLLRIADPLGNNITFSYDVNNHISKLVDTVGRAFLFCYNTSGLLQSIDQSNGTCSSETGFVRRVSYGYTSSSLSSVTDPAGRITSYTYSSIAGVGPWLLSRITYPTTWYDSYVYSSMLMGTQAISYRVSWQQVNATLGVPVRQFGYMYTPGPGDQVSNSTVAAYDGTSNRPVSFTSYAFSFAGVTWNVSDANHNLVRGVQQRFGVHGEVPREVILVSPTQSFTNFYRYDLWGNLIYSRRAISSSLTWYHESFNSYYNNGLTPGFYAFQETFSQNQGRASDNSWSTQNGYWIVRDGSYSGTKTSGLQESTFAWTDIGKSDLSLQARVYIDRQIDSSDQRVGVIAHYPGSGNYKWALVLHNTPTGIKLSLLDEYVAWVVENPCTLLYHTWYTFNFTIHGNSATGSAAAPGMAACGVSGTFPSDSVAATTGFGLYSGGYSALFDDVVGATVSPLITSTGFSNSFIPDGAPGPSGVNSWLWTTKPPSSGWNTTTNWLPAAGWSLAPRVQDYNGAPWGTISGWVDTKAQWIWWNTDAATSSTLDLVWFRRVFNLPSQLSVNIEITADNNYTIYLDGARVGSDTNWTTRKTYGPISLAPGNHLLAVQAGNMGGPAGLLLSVSDASSGRVLFHTDGVAGPNMIAPAGTAELQNGTGTTPVETYYGYYGWGGLNQVKRLYSSSSGTQWLTTARAYDGYGNLVRFTDPRGNQTTYTYSLAYKNAYLTSTTQTLIPGSLTVSSSYSYNFTTGDRLSYVDPLGSNTTYKYDILGRVTRVNYPNSLGFTAYIYNDTANYVDVSNENGWKTRQIYDGLGRLVVVDRFSGTTSYSNQTSTYNWMNKLTGKTDALGNRYLYQYDVLGRTISTVEPNGNSTQAVYNDLASWVRTADENGVYRCNVYDRLGRLISVVENTPSTCQSGIATNYYYDEVGNLAKLTTSRLQSTSYTYDNLNRLTKTSYPDGTSELFTYDSSGNLITKIDRKAVTTWFSYDSLNRVLTVNYLGTIVNSDSYTYDRNSNLVQLTSQNATINYSYDARNRLLSETYSVNTGFGMSPSSSSLTIEDGSSAQSTITLTSFNGFAGTISLSASASTAYATLSLSQSAVTLSPGGTATTVLTVSMSPYGTAGRYNVTVTGTSAGVSHTIIISLTVTDFSLTVSPQSSTVAAGRQVSVTVTAQSLSGYSGSISLSVYSGLPGCASLPVFTPGSLKLSPSGTNSSILTFNLAGSCSLSQYTVWVRGIDGTLLTRYALFGLTISGFTVSVSPGAIGVQQGYSASVTVTVTSVNLYSGSLQLSALGIPAGVTFQFSPNPVSLGSGSSSTSTLTFNVGSSTTSSTYPIAVQATDGFMSRNATMSLVVGSFALSVSPNPVTIAPGGKGNVTVTVSQDIGASGTLTLSYSGPKCVGASFNPATISLPNGGSSTLTLSVASSCAIGSYITTVSTGSKLPSTTLTLVVADFTISASPSSVSIAQGTATTSTISLSSKGFTGTVSLSASVSPVVSNGPTASLFNPTLTLSAGGSNSTSLQISASCSTPTGSYTVTVTGTSGYISHSVSISVSVTTGCTGGGGGGGGSVAAGTLIVRADGTQVAVQNLQAGMQLLSYDTTNHRFLVTTITSFVSVVTDNQMVIQTRARSPLVVDQNPAQKLYVMLPNGTQTMLSVTQLQVGYQLFIALNQTWTPITSIQYQNGGVHVMYDIYNTAPGNYIANGYLDPVKLGPTPTSTSTTTSSTSTSSSSTSTAAAVGSVTYSVNYAYTGELLSTVTYPDGFAVSYSYDSLGRLASVSQTGSVGYYANFTYYRNDQILRVNYGNGLAAAYNYDALSRPTQIKLVNGASTLLQLNYAYYKTGMVSSITGNSSSTGGTILPISELYKYDALQRLTNATVTSGSTTTTLWYEYDTVGNRLRQSQNNALVSYIYTAQNNELTSAVVPGTSTGTFYAYDPNGNLVSRNVTSTGGTVRWSYAWDTANRLVQAATGGIVQGAYAYDGMGRRVESVEGSTTTLYAYLGTGTLYEQLLGKTNVRYVYAANLRIANVTGTTVSYYHADALGSTRLMTDASGRLIFSSNYQPFGQDNGTPSGSETYKFTGKPVSATTGLYYYYHRWYDPSVGRFISQDPFAGHLSDPQTLNPYIYVTNAPTSATDPTGMDGGFGADHRQEQCQQDPNHYWCQPPSKEVVEFNVKMMWVFLGVEAVIVAAFVCVVACPAVAAYLGIGGGAACAEECGPLVNTADFFANVEADTTTSAVARLAAGQASHASLVNDIVQLYGEVPNTGPGQLRVTNQLGTYIPDFLSGTEAKSVTYLSRTSQMQIAIQNAIDTGTRFTLYTRPYTELSDPLLRYVDQHIIELIRVPFLS